MSGTGPVPREGTGERLLDLTVADEDTGLRDEPKRVATSTKTIEEAQEKVRGRLAQWLTGAVVLLIFFLAGCVAAGWLNPNEVEKLAAVVLSPLIGLAGSAAGFYFGQRHQ
jgi:membrane-bound ClpP family serine protease